MPCRGERIANFPARAPLSGPHSGFVNQFDIPMVLMAQGRGCLRKGTGRGSRATSDGQPMTASPTRVMPLSVPHILTFKFLNSKTSVRSRIVVIAVIPLIGFLINGIAFTTGESDVANAFLSTGHATDLADASEGFKAGLAAMRIGIRDFIADPSQESIATFEAGSAQASQSLHSIETSVSQDERFVLPALTRSMAAVQDNFLLVKKEQRD